MIVAMNDGAVIDFLKYWNWFITTVFSILPTCDYVRGALCCCLQKKENNISPKTK